MLGTRDFREFLREVQGVDPFPWQEQLVERVVAGKWPEVIDLPTAAGKTTCIDVAVFALACQAHLPAEQRTAPRRVFFVVDRRIVVDQTYKRAVLLASKLAETQTGVTGEVAARLRQLGGGDLPLAVAQLRGGILRSDRWSRSPAQPLVVTGTVDQIGSRLLFRTYGASPRLAAVHAGLVGTDSLIILDEAHCARPFMETLRAIRKYRELASSSLGSQDGPFAVTAMSATLATDLADVFPELRLRTNALDSPPLNRRMKSKKLTRLAVAQNAALPRRPTAKDHAATSLALANELVSHARELVSGHDCRRVAIMVNRIATADAAYSQLRELRGDNPNSPRHDVVLVTGRIRAIDRDWLNDAWQPSGSSASDHRGLTAWFTAGKDPPPSPPRPLYVVATQTLEVGADLSFDGLVTECASLDALLQRLGRVDRKGLRGEAPVVIVVRKDQEEESESDPIYGSALSRTWEWLHDRLAEANGSTGAATLDLGIAAVASLLPTDPDERRKLYAPARHAPVMLPAHVDILVQTGPPLPAPEIDVSLFLHGPDRGTPVVQVAWRADLVEPPAGWTEGQVSLHEAWPDAISACPPTALESVEVRLSRVRAWMKGLEPADEGDVEGERRREEEGVETAPAARRALIWRGREESFVTSDAADIHPGDLVIIPASDRQSLDLLVHIPPREGAPPTVDVGDQAHLLARDRAVLRLHPQVLEPFASIPAIAAIREWASDPGRLEAVQTSEELDGMLSELAGADGVPSWMSEAARKLTLRFDRRRQLVRLQTGGYAVIGRRRLRRHEPEEDPDSDADQSTSSAARPIELREHLAGVQEFVRRFAQLCGLPAATVADLALAARLHDLGKLDPRFQAYLHGGDRIASARSTHPLAKSERAPLTRSADQRARERAGLPRGFRHELLSMAIVENQPDLLDEAHSPDLVLHLIASHHGLARPFAPTVEDDDPPSLDLNHVGIRVTVDAAERRRWPPPYRLDSGIAERFWRLVRKYGWWRLAYLETMLRLADHRQSEQERSRVNDPTETLATVAQH